LRLIYVEIKRGFLFKLFENDFMKILLTGAAGFTGLVFKAWAQAQGHGIVALKADLTDKQATVLEVAAARPDAVVHLAAISFVGHADESAIYGVNVVGTTNLLQALTYLTNPPKCVLLASSANIYGNCEVSPISETQVAAPVNHYAMSKFGRGVDGFNFFRPAAYRDSAPF
jgi:nucleoside-diphosphate-sugar epimerase